MALTSVNLIETNPILVGTGPASLILQVLTEANVDVYTGCVSGSVIDTSLHHLTALSLLDTLYQHSPLSKVVSALLCYPLQSIYKH